MLHFRRTRPATEDDGPRRLGGPVLLGVLASSLAGLGLFYAFAWQQLGHAWVFSLRGATGQQVFDAARTAVTLVGVIGLGGAAFLAFRRQRTTEHAHVTTQRAQRTAAAALELNQRTFEHDTIRVLRERYTSATEQLGSDSFAVRLAGLYAIAALADDWYDVGYPTEQQVCIDVMCAYLRASTVPMKEVPLHQPGLVVTELVEDVQNGARAEHEVRRTALRIIVSRCRPRLADPSTGDDTKVPAPGPWSNTTLDLTGAQLVDANFAFAQIDRLDLTGATLTGNTSFTATTVTTGYYDHARFVASSTGGGKLDFTGSDVADASFQYASFDVPVLFTGATFKGSANFSHAIFNTLAKFGTATFAEGSSTLFRHAEFLNDVADFTHTRLDGTVNFSAVDMAEASAFYFTGASGQTRPLADWVTPPGSVHGWPPHWTQNAQATN